MGSKKKTLAAVFAKEEARKVKTRAEQLQGYTKDHLMGLVAELESKLVGLEHQVALFGADREPVLPAQGSSEEREVVEAFLARSMDFQDAGTNRAIRLVLRAVNREEPVFVLAAHDELAPDTVDSWAEGAFRSGVRPERVIEAKNWAVRMRNWQRRNGCRPAGE